MATILVANGRETNRQYLSTLLKAYNHHLLEASDGHEALNILKKESADLVISDVIMPRLTGYELVQLMQKSPRLSRVPVIFYTEAFSIEDITIMAMKYRVKYVLHKPCSPSLIIETVNKALEQSSEELKKSIKSYQASTNVGTENNTINARLSQYIEEVRHVKSALDTLLVHTQHVISEGDQLTQISESFTHNLNKLLIMSNRLFLLVEFKLSLLTYNDLNHLLEAFCKGSRKIMESKFCVVSILDDDKKSLKYYYISNNTVSKNNKLIPSINTDFVRKMLSQKSAVIINDIKQLNKAELPQNHPVEKNILSVPILNQNQIYGFVYYADKFDEAGFNQTDEEFATILTLDIAIMYEYIKRHRTNT